MKNLFCIEGARVSKVGQYATVTNTDRDGNSSVWHSFPFIINYDYDYQDGSGNEVHATASAAIRLRADQAIWAKDNLRTGMTLNLWCHTYGTLYAFNSNGQYRERTENSIIADFAQVVETTPAAVQTSAPAPEASAAPVPEASAAPAASPFGNMYFPSHYAKE